ncbi:hypothetical protein CLV60_1472 [Dyadobacter jiangsuensis]|uniref:Uncharacterized protein n=1 Tax=Dyadobacter jiangsuensis TaxID=1591085 RepID=A0A2P8F671_9BACT|nr:hypothetical protein CLV60_1472 [Dyadobacter jiangsuensis]
MFTLVPISVITNMVFILLLELLSVKVKVFA